MKKYYLVIILMITLPTTLLAQSTEGTSDNHSHDGLFINLSLGYASDETIIEDYYGEECILTGNAIICRFKLGWTIINNLILYGVIGISNQRNPDVDSAVGSGKTQGITVRYYDFGAGLAFYFPYNIYFSTSFARTQSRWETGQGNLNSKPGFSLTLTLGKEWWLSENIGVGLAIIVSFARLKPGEEIGDSAYASKTMNHSFAGIAASVTYN